MKLLKELSQGLFAKRCQKCLMMEHVRGITFEDDLCNYCRTEPYLIDEPTRQEYLADFHDTIESLKKHDGRYNCIIASSGGKDSAYLLYLAVNKYKLRPLSVTVDTGFMNPTAIKNVDRIVGQLNVDHQYIKPDVELFKSIYRHYLTTKNLDQNILFENCNLCTNLMDIEMTFLAEEKGIPVIFTGISPDEIRYFKDRSQTDDDVGYEIKHDNLVKNLERRESAIKSMGKPLHDAIQRHKSQEKTIRIVFPFHALPYDAQQIRAELKKKKLIAKSKSHPLVTNCIINWILIYSLVKKTGHNPYIWMISDLVRDNPKLRRSYLAMDRMANAMVHLEIFQRKNIKYILDELNLEKSQIL